jgi:hypothetical protein
MMRCFLIVALFAWCLILCAWGALKMGMGNLGGIHLVNSGLLAGILASCLERGTKPVR